MQIKTLLISAFAVALGLVVGLWAYQKFVVPKLIAAQPAPVAAVSTQQAVAPTTVLGQVQAMLAADEAV